MSDADSRRGWSSGLLLGSILAAAVALAIAGGLSSSMGGAKTEPSPEPASTISGDRTIAWQSDSVLHLSYTAPETPSEASILSRDIRVRAILEGYGALIDSVAYRDGDVVFSLPGGSVHFQDGRMLSEENLAVAQDFDPIFYPYPLQPLDAPPPAESQPTYSRDFLRHLFGTTEEEIREHGVSAEFLNRRVFVNAYCLEALKAVEADIRALAREDSEVTAWIRDIKIAYSFIDKEIAGTRGRSHHAWGMAIDLIPSSYRGKHVYWRWSRVFNRENWSGIPVEERWSPPEAVIEAFESHGFVWGGKWSRFDTIHFEYRPEIVAFSRMMAQVLP